ncbi:MULTISPECIES: hypothetical protein [unclassified Clostridium]|uniref:hypothetical protein n=1 Tax=Clostridium TaxID=1485 RepID=UPI001C8C1255|nr:MULTISPECIES: hypothetical protein [unclassified Clostridium]MBX9135931.1 hypothetical protein [Clostridium sp. K12(2020)]MBX9142661.1 hypothetical protein [Clostridium sp. K13]MDU2291668.1 hypothetical protein [Clostridium celatum]MDU4326872.1 hypothetical protein [Clostridium celatum]
MLEKLNRKIQKLKNDVTLKKILDEEILRLEEKVKLNEEKLYSLERQQIKEKRDVDKLNKISISNIIATLLNNKEDKLEKEEKEYLLAKLKYDELLSSINILKEDLANEKNRLISLGNCEEEYNELIKEKVNFIKTYGDKEVREKLSNIDNEIDDLIKESKEIEEAYSVGRRLLIEVNEAEEELRGAKNWGIFDIAGGDLISTIAKHNKINNANDKFEKIVHLISKFNKELGDINLNNVSFSAATMTLDLFFDNIFTDILVQNKINDLINNMESLKRRVESIMRNLQERYDNLEKKHESLNKEYSLVIEKL